jgi:hypothetical protein
MKEVRESKNELEQIEEEVREEQEAREAEEAKETMRQSSRGKQVRRNGGRSAAAEVRSGRFWLLKSRTRVAV